MVAAGALKRFRVQAPQRTHMRILCNACACACARCAGRCWAWTRAQRPRSGWPPCALGLQSLRGAPSKVRRAKAGQDTWRAFLLQGESGRAGGHSRPAAASWCGPRSGHSSVWPARAWHVLEQSIAARQPMNQGITARQPMNQGRLWSTHQTFPCPTLIVYLNQAQASYCMY